MRRQGDDGYLATHLTWLFDEVRRPDGNHYSFRQAANGINTMAGKKLVSYEYLSLLRAGKRQNPSFGVMVAVARWFGVETDYFTRFKAASPDSTSRPSALAGSRGRDRDPA